MFKSIWIQIQKTLKIGIEWLKPKASVAITIVNALKKTVENPVTSFVVNLTATKLDDQLLAKAKDFLAKASEEMLIAEGIINGGMSAQDVLDNIIALLRSKSKEARAKWWTELQGKLTVYLADGKIDLGEGIALGQMVYKEIHSSN